jgi:hypothetical protein
MQIDYNTVKRKVADVQANTRNNATLIRDLHQGYFLHLIKESDPKISWKRISDAWYQSAESPQHLWNVYDRFLKIMHKEE